ncbi:MAG: cyclic-di-AMP-binding protein CbpB [Lactococcus sp.]|uniref:cyclic-di-AMP-binding protein CbpB n=1 Tax=Lactococcus sp. TaxID=44273 RepID=UPI0035B10E1E
MIDKSIKAFILDQSETFVKKAEDVAVLYAEHNLSHAKLLLSQYQYTRVPVLNEAKAYVGVIGLTDIVNYEMMHENASDVKISEVVNKEVPTLQANFTLEEILNLLVKEPFIPILQGETFKGIVVRQEILKAFNAFAHDFTKKYEINERN